MQVQLIAYTSVTTEALGTLPLGPSGPTVDADYLGEFAGRACYQSFDRPNPETASTRSYLANILKQGHESVLEHASLTFYVTGVSRSLTHELIRHRHLSYSELSQRFIDPTESQPVIPPVIRDSKDFWSKTEVREAWESATELYGDILESLEDEGLNRKQLREAARAVLPNATETRIVVTGNIRAWRDVLKKRHHVAADAEIQEFAAEVLRHLRKLAPGSVQDIPDEAYGEEPAPDARLSELEAENAALRADLRVAVDDRDSNYDFATAVEDDLGTAQTRVAELETELDELKSALRTLSD